MSRLWKRKSMTESHYSMEFPKRTRHVFETRRDNEPQKKAKRFDMGPGDLMATILQARLFTAARGGTLCVTTLYPSERSGAKGERSGQEGVGDRRVRLGRSPFTGDRNALV